MQKRTWGIQLALTLTVPLGMGVLSGCTDRAGTDEGASTGSETKSADATGGAKCPDCVDPEADALTDATSAPVSNAGRFRSLAVHTDADADGSGDVEGDSDSVEVEAPPRPIAPIQLKPDPDILETIIGHQLNMDLTFTTHEGEDVKLSDYLGKTLVITTIYTSCPIEEMCPRMTADIAWLAKQVPDELVGDIRFLVVSFDPQNDTPKVLKAFGELQGVDFRQTDMLVADIETTRQLMEYELQIPVEVDLETNTIVTHAVMVHVVNPDGYIVVERTTPNHNAVEVIAEEMVRAATYAFDPEGPVFVEP